MNEKKLGISNMAIQDYFSIIKDELNYENNRKRDLETKSSFVLAFFIGLAVYVFDKIKLSNLKMEVFVPLPTSFFIYFFSTIILYGIIAFGIYFIYKSLQVKETMSYPTDIIDKEKITSERLPELLKIIPTYQKVIHNKREINNNKAISIKHALRCLLSCIIPLVVLQYFHYFQ